MYLPRFAPGRLLPIICALLVLAGCSTGIRPVTPVQDARIQEQARQLEAADDFQGAATAYLDAASEAASPLKEEYLLEAADSLISGGSLDHATLIIDNLATGQLSVQQRQHLEVTRARLALAAQQPEKALEILKTPLADGMYAADYHKLRGKALFLMGDYAASATEYITRNALISDPAAQLDNQFLTWEAVNSLNDTNLQQLRSAPPPDVFSGWLELVELTRLYLQQPDALAAVIPHWQMRYPGHPASPQFTTELLGNLRSVGQPPEQVALLLPLSGTLSGAATAIRDGLLAAYYDTSDGINRSLIRVYDTGLLWSEVSSVVRGDGNKR